MTDKHGPWMVQQESGGNFLARQRQDGGWESFPAERYPFPEITLHESVWQLRAYAHGLNDRSIADVGKCEK